MDNHYYINKYYQTGTILEDKKTKKKYKVVATSLENMIEKGYFNISIGSILYYARLKEERPWSLDFSPMDWVNWWKETEKVCKRRFTEDLQLYSITLLPIVYLSHNTTVEKIKRVFYNSEYKIYLADEQGEILEVYYNKTSNPVFDFKVLTSVNNFDKKLNEVLAKVNTLRLKDKKNTLTALYEEYYEPLTWYDYYKFVSQYGKNFVIVNHRSIYQTDEQGRFFRNGQEVTTCNDGSDIKSNITFSPSSDKKKIRDYFLSNYLTTRKHSKNVIEEAKEFYG